MKRTLVLSISTAVLLLCANLRSGNCQTKPTVVATVPANGATGVSTNITSIVITFSKAMNAGTGCGVATSNWLSPQSNSCSWSADKKTLTFTRLGSSPPPFAAGTVVTVYLNFNSTILQDTEGNVLDPYTFSFTIFSLSTFEQVPANPQRGFSWPYYLRTPNVVKEPAILLVEPNNTGTVNDDWAVHDLAAKNEALAWGARMDELGCPYLIPTFPRPAAHSEVYTQALDRNTILTRLSGLVRLDLQLLAMIDDARERLAAKNINVDAKVFMMGYSASGQFASRFVMLHPDRIKAASFGSPMFGPIAPVARWSGQTLPYHIGIADLEQLVGRKFDVETFKQVPLQVYVGDMDTNIVPWYVPSSDSDSALVEAAFGGDGPEDFWRWANFEAAYASVQSSCQFVVFPGEAHQWPEWSFLKEFFERNRTTPPPAPLPKPYLYTLYFPHAACGGGWQTEIAITNTGQGSPAHGSLQAFGSDGGQPLESVPVTIPPAGRKEIAVCGFFSRPESIAYLSFLSDTAFIAGYTRFSQEGTRASLGAATGSKHGWFLKMERDGWTGIAFVNVEAAEATVTLSAIDDGGSEIARETLRVPPGKKFVGMTTELFRIDVSRATYFKYDSDKKLLGFTVSSSADGTMLDGLASMPQFSRYIGRER